MCGEVVGIKAAALSGPLQTVYFYPRFRNVDGKAVQIEMAETAETAETEGWKPRPC